MYSCWHLLQDPWTIISLLELKRGLTCWERVSPDETCIRVRERCVWAFCGAKLMVGNHYGPYKAVQDLCLDICQESFSREKEVKLWILIFSDQIAFSEFRLVFLSWKRSQNTYFQRFSLEELKRKSILLVLIVIISWVVGSVFLVLVLMDLLDLMH